MSEIAVRVVNPGGERTAQLLDDRAPSQELVAVLVVRLVLPEGPNYRLVDESSRQVLRPTETLGALGVTHGDLLRLEVVRDGALDFVLKQLYKQARKQVRRKLWQLAREKLHAIRRLDPLSTELNVAVRNRFLGSVLSRSGTAFLLRVHIARRG